MEISDVFKAYRGLKKDFQSCFDVMITFAGPNRYVTLPWMVSWYEDRSAFIITAMIGKGSTFVDSFVLDVKKWPAGWREDVAECRNTLHSFTMNAVGPMLRARLNSCNVVGDGYVFDPTHSGWNCLYHFDSHTNEDGVMGVLTFVLDTTKTEISD